MSGFQGWIFAQNLSDYWATLSDSLSSLFKKSDREGIALVTLAGATVSNSLRPLMTKSDCERIALSLFKKEQSQWFARDSNELLKKKQAIHLKKVFFVCFFAQEQIAHVALRSVILF